MFDFLLLPLLLEPSLEFLNADLPILIRVSLDQELFVGPGTHGRVVDLKDLQHVPELFVGDESVLVLVILNCVGEEHFIRIMNCPNVPNKVTHCHVPIVLSAELLNVLLDLAFGPLPWHGLEEEWEVRGADSLLLLIVRGHGTEGLLESCNFLVVESSHLQI